ncbi:ABC transporter substrate-binding protein [Amycolatopsis sp. GM8]|uniref:ABC transporter substrate-binding protein n=1 Tax=Amycolatopsis sp. GM8 TaxID=2896530 RepID=UPI001F1A7EB3|nr:ABC transporter substrate-binding protein [Amycolatopsis sp. GM8]
MKKIISVCLTALTVIALVAGCGAGQRAGESGGLTTIRVGTEKVTSDAGIFLADRLGYFKEAGIQIDYQRLNDAPSITNALATGHLEVAGASLAPGVFSALNRDIEIRVVGDKQSSRPGVSATQFAVRSEYARPTLDATLQALRGKKIAVHSKLSIQVFMLSNFLQRHGMSLSDFQVTPVLSPDQIGALKGNSVDAAVMLEPYLTEAVEAGIVKPASDLTEAAPPDGEVLTGLLYGKELLENRQLGTAFMVAYMRGVRAYNDAMFHDKNKQQAEQIIADESNTPLDLVQKTNPSGLDPEQRLDPAYLDRLQQFYVQQGTLTKAVKSTDVIDTSYADAARTQLGPYKPPAP